MLQFYSYLYVFAIVSFDFGQIILNEQKKNGRQRNINGDQSNVYILATITTTKEQVLTKSANNLIGVWLEQCCKWIKSEQSSKCMLSKSWVHGHQMILSLMYYATYVIVCILCIVSILSKLCVKVKPLEIQFSNPSHNLLFFIL